MRSRGAPQSPCATTPAAYVAGCLFRAFGVCAHALPARAGRWGTNEKGLVAVAAPCAPAGRPTDVQALLGALGSSPDELAVSLARARSLVDAARAAVRRD